MPTERINASVQVVVAVAMMLAIYTLLEGFPALPPMAAKQKLSWLFAGIGVALAMASNFPIKSWLLTIILLAFGLAWLGANKLMGVAAWPQALLMFAPIIATAFGTSSLETRASEVLLWPSALLAFAIGGSLLSLLGVFVGFAEPMGAFAAWLGGYMLLQFLAILLGRGTVALSPVALQSVVLCFVSISFMVALFAPDISLLAYAILSLSLLVPNFAPKLSEVSSITKPFIFGFLAAVPAVAAILIAFIQRGLTIG